MTGEELVNVSMNRYYTIIVNFQIFPLASLIFLMNVVCMEKNALLEPVIIVHHGTSSCFSECKNFVLFIYSEN